MLYEAAGISHYDALQTNLTKRFSKGFQLGASYTWSHALDEQSGLGLFYNGNNPLDLRSGYGNADFDRPHVFALNYVFEVPTLLNGKGLANKQIAWRLGISEKTVKAHLRSIFRKLEVGDRAQAVAYAMRRGLVE